MPFLSVSGYAAPHTHSLLSLRAIADGVAISFLLLCRSGAYAPCAYPRICSNCAAACFHILGFIASHRRWRGNPVSLCPHAYACDFTLIEHNKKIKALYQVPLYGGVPRSGGVVREIKKASPPRHHVIPHRARDTSNYTLRIKKRPVGAFFNYNFST